MRAEPVDPQGSSYTIATTLGRLQLWIIPELRSSFGGLSDRTLATWVYVDDDVQLAVLGGLRRRGGATSTSREVTP